MEHLKKYEDFDRLNEELNLYEVKRFVLEIITLPIVPIVYGLIQLIPLEHKMSVITDLIDIYSNMDKMITALRASLNDINIPDSSKEKIEYKLKQLEKMKRKYPTLEDYKNKLKKFSFLYSVRNRNYLNNQIDIYQPRNLRFNELMEKLKKISKYIDRESTRNALVEPVVPRNPEEIAADPFGEEVTTGKNNNEDDWWDSGYDEKRHSEFQKRLKEFGNRRNPI